MANPQKSTVPARKGSTKKTTSAAHRNLPLLMLQVRDRLIDRFRHLLKTYGLTEQQYRVLRLLHSQGPLEPRQIGALCHISSPSLAGVLARMDDMGLVSRERLEHDQRRVMVSLTEHSTDMVEAMLPEVEATYKQLERDLGAGFAAEVYATLDRMLTLLGPQEEDEDAP